MLSKIFDIPIITKFIIIYIFNICVFLLFIVYSYNFTNNNIKQLQQTGKYLLPIASITNNNLQLLEDIITTFSDTALTNELDMIDNAKSKQRLVLKNINKLKALNINIKQQKKLFIDYFNLAQKVTIQICTNTIDYNNNKNILTLQNLSSKTIKNFQNKKISADIKLKNALNNISNNSNIFFNNLLFISLFGLILIAFANFIILRFLKIRFQDIINSVKNLAIAKPDFSKRLKSNKNDEIGEIIRWFNQLQSKLELDHIELETLKKDVEESLEKEIEETQKEVVFTMGAIGESRSKETGNHVKRVAEYSKLLALHYGLSYKDAELLKQASPMHDIGKVGIADSILNKPSKLTIDEFEKMKLHAQLGYEMLKSSNRPLLKLAATVAYEHHEKWDGTGYPRGLKGKEINIYGRITALADVFDALGSNRIYKKSWDDDKIFKLFKEEKSKHFDPTLIDIFFNHLDEFLLIRDKFKDTIT